MEPTFTVCTEDMKAELTTDKIDDEVLVHVSMPGGDLTLCSCHCLQLLDLLVQVDKAMRERNLTTCK